jgi:hypothetical protein
VIADAVPVIGVLVVVSVLGDVVHALLHRWGRSPLRVLRWLAGLHEAHHRFLAPTLVHDDAWLGRSLLRHHLPELGMRLFLATVVSALFAIDDAVRAVVWCGCALDLPVVLWRRGRDPWHRGRPVHAPRGRVFVDGSYHALHHAFPSHYLSAHVQLLDRLLGTLMPLRGRRILVTGASVFVGDLHRALASAGADVRRVAEDAVDDSELGAADILVLGHGADDRGPCAYEALLSRACRAHADSVLPLEVWAVGDDVVWRARAPLLNDDRVTLRLLFGAPRRGATRTLALLRRGATRL